MKQAFLFFLESIQKYKKYYFLMILAPILGAFYKPIIYYAMKMMVDIISTNKEITFSQLAIPLLIYIALDIMLSALWRSGTVFGWKSEPFVARDILLRALKTTLAYRYSFFQNKSSGSIISKIKGLFDGCHTLWDQILYSVTYWALGSVAIIGSMFFINILAGFIILFWSIIFVVSNYFLSIKLNNLSRIHNDAKHAVIGELSDSLSNSSSIKLFSNREYEYNKLSSYINHSWIPKAVATDKFRFKVDVFNDILGISMIFGMICIMIKLRQMGLVSVGDFVFVFGMIFQIQENLWHLMGDLNKVADTAGDINSSLSIYSADESEYTTSNTVIINTAPKIEFRNVDFSYNATKHVFSNLNLIIQPAERIGIVGFTGAGKTTLINLLLKIFNPANGEIYLNNTNSADIDTDVLRSFIGVIPQDTNLFHRNIMENIRYGNIHATDERVINAAITAHADEFIKKLPQQYETLVGERGVKLSGGQRQRIAIARAVLKNAPILLLDEATSALDSVTERYLQDSMVNLLANKTVIAIAHRLSTLRAMDRLIVIDEGKIVESGTHDALLEQNTLYAKIWHTQYAKY